MKSHDLRTMRQEMDGVREENLPLPATTLEAIEEQVYRTNTSLNQTEYELQHIYLRSMPRSMTVVLGNACNIYCPHCYQSKNGDHLLRHPEIGQELRREFIGMYPYLSTLRLQGGEVFALQGFKEMLEDIATTVTRPIVSISTNGTLIDDEWAERIVRTPFQTVTVSIDAGRAETFARVRRGAHLDSVLGNIQRIQDYKVRLSSDLPGLDSFYVVMRSNFREVPQYLELMKEVGVYEVALQTVLVDERNLTREPGLVNEVLSDPREVKEFHELLSEVLPQERRHFRRIAVSGLRSLFEEHGLDSGFLKEETLSLYPDQERGLESPDSGAAPAEEQDSIRTEETKHPAPGVMEERIELCPNPWSTVFITEGGDVLLCFLSEPVGNLYEQPLVRIWNSQRAMAKRSQMIAGDYLSSGCSDLWCSWREGKCSEKPAPETATHLRSEFKRLIQLALKPAASEDRPEIPSYLGAVRRLLTARERRITELETNLVDLCDKNRQILETMATMQRIQEMFLVRVALALSVTYGRLKLGLLSLIRSSDRCP